MKSKLLKIAILGPESTGKTTLAKQLAAHYEAIYIAEYAREYIGNLQRAYTVKDVLLIAQQQFLHTRFARQKGKNLLIADTELIVTKIWHEYIFKKKCAWIDEHIAKQDFDLYLLTNVDVKWVADAQREHSDQAQRQEIFELYETTLKKLALPFVVIRGKSYENRLKQAKKAVEFLVRSF